jgi:hypothetical protein
LHILKLPLLLALLQLTPCGSSNDLAHRLVDISKGIQTCPYFVSLLFKILSLRSPEKMGELYLVHSLDLRGGTLKTIKHSLTALPAALKTLLIAQVTAAELVHKAATTGQLLFHHATHTRLV